MKVSVSLTQGADFCMVQARDQDGSGSKRIMKVNILLLQGADSCMVQPWDQDASGSRRSMKVSISRGSRVLILAWFERGIRSVQHPNEL